VAVLAERFFADDPNTCLLKLRQRAAANLGFFAGSRCLGQIFGGLYQLASREAPFGLA